MATPRQTDPQFKLRLPAQLKERIDQSADANNRSINAEIVARLEESFEEQKFLERYSMRRDEVREKLESTIAELNTEMGIILSDAKRERQAREQIEQTAVELQARLDGGSKGDSPVPLPEDRTLYVALDAEGMPLSWPEITRHLEEIGRAGGFKIDRIEACVVDAGSASSSDREEEWLRLVSRYRQLLKSRTTGSSSGD